MDRRTFFRSLAATTGALVLPYEPKRIYSFGEDVGRVVPADFATLHRMLMSQMQEYIETGLINPSVIDVTLDPGNGKRLVVKVPGFVVI
jgi:hypothetical protein